jgi:hypothetical protein
MTLLLFIICKTSEFGSLFLAISPGATQVGLGMGGVAYPNDIPGIYYNPANINFTNTGFYIQNTPIPESWNLIFSKMVKEFYTDKDAPYSPDYLLYHDMKYIYGGIKFPSYKYLNFGINYTFLSSGETIATINNNEYNWYTYDYSLGVTIGTSYFNNLLNFGITFKYIYSLLASKEFVEKLRELYEEYEGLKGSSSLFSYDVGLLIKDPLNFSRCGISYSNISGSIGYIENGSKDPLPRVIRYGFSLFPINSVDYLLNRHTSFPYDIKNYFNAKYVKEILTDRVGTEHNSWYSSGWEYTFFNFLSFRNGRFCDKLGGREGNTRSVGLKIANIKLDYADNSDIYEVDNFQVSLSVDLMKGDNKYFAIPLSLMFPGAGHMYLGSVKKGLLYCGAGTLISMLYPFEDERKIDIYSTLFYLLSIISTVDLAWSL